MDILKKLMDINGYFKEINGNKYLSLVLTSKNKNYGLKSEI